MAAKKTASKKTPKTTARGAKTAKRSAAPKKHRFYATPNRLFAAAATEGALPKGTYLNLPTEITGMTVRVGTPNACVYEGPLSTLLNAALGKQGLKVKIAGPEIASFAVPPAAPATPSL